MNKNKVFIIGGTGGIGQAIAPLIGYHTLTVGSKVLNLAKSQSIKSFVENEKPLSLVLLSVVNHNNMLHKYTDDNMDQLYEQLQVNITGTIELVCRALKYMREANYGRIILASSIVVKNPVAGTGIYAASKATYENLVKTIALENAEKDITANALRLGYINAGLFHTIPEHLRQEIVKKIPAGGPGGIECVAKTVEFILEANYLNGSVIELAGGL